MSNFKKHKAITTYVDLSDKKISKSFWIGKADGYTSKWHIKAKPALASCAPAASGEVQEKKEWEWDVELARMDRHCLYLEHAIS